MNSVIIDGILTNLDDLAAWIGTAGGALALICVALTQVFWTLWARVAPLKPLSPNKKRAISFLLPAVLGYAFYLGTAFIGRDHLTWGRFAVWTAVVVFAITGKQLGYIFYVVVRGEAPPAGTTPSLVDLAALLKTDWLKVLQNLPTVLPILLAAITPPAPTEPVMKDNPQTLSSIPNSESTLS